KNIYANKFKKRYAAYPAWSKDKTVDDLREYTAEYQLIESGKTVGLLTKNEMKALHGLLNKRNECAHPSNYFPGLNDSLGYVSELVQSIRHLKGKRFCRDRLSRYLLFFLHANRVL